MTRSATYSKKGISPVSRIIHLMWYQGLSDAPSAFALNPKKWEQLNPGYTILKWCAESLTEFIADKYPQYFVAWCSIRCADRKIEIIKKCDFARLLLIHHFGGVYADLDLVPKRSIDSFLDGGEIRHRATGGVSVLPDPDPVESVDLRKYGVVLSREHGPIDHLGWGIANGIILSSPNLALWTDFIDSRLHEPGVKVLDYMGTWAFTRFLRSKLAKLRGVACVVPPYYFLWERRAMAQPIPDWSVAEHLALNSWGDHTREDWWNI